jgi:Protein of unknown function (DUF433)
VPSFKRYSPTLLALTPSPEAATVPELNYSADLAPAPASDSRVVVISPTVSFGRPVIAGTGIPVSSIFGR